jgi:hypothetical protein
MAVDLEYYGVPPADYRILENRARLIATAGQTTFTAPYSVGYVDIYFNGAKLDAFTEFTATDGATFSLTSAAAAGDILEVISRGQVQLADVYSQEQVNALFTPFFGIATGTGNAQVVVTNPTFSSFTDGMTIKVRTVASNSSTAPTIALNGLTAKTIVSNNAGAALYGTDWVAGSDITLRYNQSADRLILIDGNTTIKTPAKFDNSNQAASTAFVTSMLGNFQAMTVLTANTTITTAQSGTIFECTGSSAFTLTLPSPATVNITFTVLNASSAFVNLTTPNGNIFYVGTTAATVGLAPASAVQLISDGSNWIAINGNGAGSFTSNGYQKLGSGLIIQWGVATSSTSGDVPVGFPIAFPRAILSLTLGATSITVGGGFAATNSLSTTGFNLNGWNSQSVRAPVTAMWIALGV